MAQKNNPANPKRNRQGKEMVNLDPTVDLQKIREQLRQFWPLSSEKILAIKNTYDHTRGAPVFTRAGQYTSRGWTEWTQGFEIGSALLQYDATGDDAFLDLGRQQTLDLMPPHLTHFGVHDHGFNTVSTYGNLWRIQQERGNNYPYDDDVLCRTAIACSGAVQAKRWSTTEDGSGYIYSFNGPHSLFADTIRSLRVLALAHKFGHVLLDENDRAVSLLQRLGEHALTTSHYTVYHGENRDRYDVPGRVAHESVFNPVNGSYRCPATHQGYSPFTTWTRGLAWIILGFAEEIEFLQGNVTEEECASLGGKQALLAEMDRTLTETADFYINNTPTDGIPYWDTGAPGLHRLENCLDRNADPFNEWEPVDSSAAAIAAQGLLRAGRIRERQGHTEAAQTYTQAGLNITHTLLNSPYLSTSPNHQGLLLHSVYHHPNGWDYIPEGAKIPYGESSMWGDYHLRELALLVQRLADNQPYLTFWGSKQ